MLCRKHRVFHAGLPGDMCIICRVIMYRIKCLKIFSVFFRGDLPDTGIPFALSSHGIEAKVDKHAESCICKPFLIGHLYTPHFQAAPEDCFWLWQVPYLCLYSHGNWYILCG